MNVKLSIVRLSHFLLASLSLASLTTILACTPQLTVIDDPDEPSPSVPAQEGERIIQFTAGISVSCIGFGDEDGESGTDGGDGTLTPSTRATAADAVSRLTWILTDADGTVLATEHQQSSGSGFGSNVMKLSYGGYKIIVVGHNGPQDCMVMDAAHIGFGDSSTPLTDTFWACMELEVDADTPAQQIGMVRRVAKFELVATDVLTSAIASVGLTASGGGMVLNGLTGLAAASAVQQKSVTIPQSYVGKTGVTYTLYTFLPAVQGTIDVSATAFGPSGEAVNDYEWSDVTMTLNRRTRYSGIFYEPMSGFDSSLSFSTEWDGVDEKAF